MTTKFRPSSLNGDLYRFMDYEDDPQYQRMRHKAKSPLKVKKSGSVLKKSKSVPKRSTSSAHKAKTATKKVRTKSSSRAKSSAKKTVKKVFLKDQEQQTFNSISTQEPTYFGILKNGQQEQDNLNYYNQYSPESRDSDILGHSRSAPMYNSAVPDPFLNKQPDGRNVSADI